MSATGQLRSLNKVFFLNNLEGEATLDELNELTMKLISAKTTFGKSELKSIFIINQEWQSVTRITIDGLDKDSMIRSMVYSGNEDARDFLYYHEPVVGEIESPIDAFICLIRYYQSLRIKINRNADVLYSIQPLSSEWVVVGTPYKDKLLQFNSKSAAEKFMEDMRPVLKRIKF